MLPNNMFLKLELSFTRVISSIPHIPDLFILFPLFSFSIDDWIHKNREVFLAPSIQFIWICTWPLLFCLFLISVLRNYIPLSCVTRLLASSLIPPPPESYSPATFNCLPLEIWACNFSFPQLSPSCDELLFLLQAPDLASNLNPKSWVWSFFHVPP